MMPALEVSMTDRPAPARTRRTGCAPAPRDWPNAKTAAPANPAPAKAHQTYWSTDVRPKAVMPMSTASAAPALTPSRPGSARGLRVTACMSAPATPSAMPARMATTVRGMRSRLTIRCWSSRRSGARSAPRMSASAMSREPTVMPSTAMMASASSPPARPSQRLQCRGARGAREAGRAAAPWSRARMAQRKWLATASTICCPE